MVVFGALILLAAIGIVLMPRTAWGYVKGQPTLLVVGDIGNGLVLRVDAAVAFLRMQSAAASDGISLKPSGPRSAFRTTEDQLSLTEERGLISQGGFAAAVNKSPHQAGIALDLETANGTNGAYAWLVSNANRFGWKMHHQLYPHANVKEPWHIEFWP